MVADVNTADLSESRTAHQNLRQIPRLLEVSTFNLGAGALQRSTLRRTVNREEHDAVPAEFGRWVWAGGRKLKGLIRRREAEAVLYAGGRHGTRRAIG